ncbi:MAG: OsmC family protein [Anaerolineales bacterium]|nr:OsmC family protein [Anaerolineales bacterium]
MDHVKGTVYIKWIESKYMTGVDSRGNSLVMGRSLDREPPWSGLKPSDLLLLAAASCSTYDVLMILEKQREPVEGIEVACIGEQEKEPLYKFVSIHIHYEVKGQVNPDKVARAINLSEEKYCSVTNTLKPALKITSDFVVID